MSKNIGVVVTGVSGRMGQMIVSRILDNAQLELVGEAAAGLVKVTMTGRHDVKSVAIDQSLMAEKKDLLEDLLAASVNDAVLKVEKSQKQHMSSLTGGMNLPEGFKMPF